MPVRVVLLALGEAFGIERSGRAFVMFDAAGCERGLGAAEPGCWTGVPERGDGSADMLLRLAMSLSQFT